MESTNNNAYSTSKHIMSSSNQNSSDNNSLNKEPFNIENDPYIETPWNIIETYFKDQHLERLVRHQLESYNNFVGYQIIKTIEMFNPVNVKFLKRASWGNISFIAPLFS